MKTAEAEQGDFRPSKRSQKGLKIVGCLLILSEDRIELIETFKMRLSHPKLASKLF